MNFSTGDYTVGTSGSGASVEFDYNAVYAGSSGDTSYNYKGTELTYANFKTACSCQTHDVTSDPLFTSFPSTLTLQSGSPAKYAGIAQSPVLSATDKNGYSWHAPPSMGAFEYGSTIIYLPFRY